MWQRQRAQQARRCRRAGGGQARRSEDWSTVAGPADVAHVRGRGERQRRAAERARDGLLVLRSMAVLGEVGCSHASARQADSAVPNGRLRLPPATAAAKLYGVGSTAHSQSAPRPTSLHRLLRPRVTGRLCPAPATSMETVVWNVCVYTPAVFIVLIPVLVISITLITTLVTTTTLSPRQNNRTNQHAMTQCDTSPTSPRSSPPAAFGWFD